MVIKIILIVFFLVMSAFFSGSEIAYSKVNTFKLEREAKKADKKSIRALKVVENFESVLSTILIGNNIVNIALSSVCSIVALDIARGMPENKVATITTIIVTITVLIFGEIIPKTICQNYSYSLSRLFSRFILFLNKILYPAVFVVNIIVRKLAKLFKFGNNDNNEVISLDDELKTMTQELKETGEIDQDEEELINSAIDFTMKTAWEIMVPRVDVLAFDIEDGLDNIINDDSFYERSRVPLYRETIDNIVGVLSSTDVLKRKLNHEYFKIDDVLYKPIFVHKTMYISDVLSNLKDNHAHLAIVLDEWGGVMGIITLEDVLEELFGDIFDEIDEVEYEYEQLSDNTYLVDGDMNIHDLFDLVEYDDRDFESEYSTVGGFCTDMLEKFPSVGENFDFDRYNFSIKEVDGPRVEKILVTVNEKEEEINDEE